MLGAGGPAGVNVCRALHAAGHEVVGLDTNSFHLPWAAPFCAETVLCPGFDDPAFRSLIDMVAPDVVHSQPEQGVEWLARNPDVPSLQPAAEVIEECSDKRIAADIWHVAKLRTHPTFAIGYEIPDYLHLAADTLGLPFWLRARAGAGARGATLVENLAQGFHWIRYWRERGAKIGWVAEEYLPGRDYCWTSLWHRGVLIAGFARERLEWIYPHLAPSGRTGTPTVAVTVHDQHVSCVAIAAVLAIDPEPTGIYCVDLREDQNVTPRPTEINAGRWATTSPLYHSLGPNLPDMHVRLAAGEHVEPLGDDVYPAGVHLLRHIDCGTLLIPEAELMCLSG